MFRKGTYQFNREPNFNFQLNRVVMWGNGDPEEVLSVSEGITDSRSWVDALTSLARKAEEEGRTEAQIGYLTEHVHSYEWGSNPSCYKGGKEIGKDLSKARPGDVICYKYGNGKRTPQNSHVSIYIGDGKEVHCAGDTNGKGGVVISKVNKKDIYNIVRFN